MFKHSQQRLIDFGDGWTVPPPKPKSKSFREMFLESMDDEIGLLWVDIEKDNIRVIHRNGKPVTQAGVKMNSKMNYVKALHCLIQETERDDVRLAAIKFVIALEEAQAIVSNANGDNVAKQTVINIDDLAVYL